MKNIIIIKHPDILGNQNTFLDSQANSGDTTITVRNISGFTTNQLILIGDFGIENTEIIKTHLTTPPSGNTITLASALKNNHPSRSRVWVLDYDKVLIKKKSGNSFVDLDTIDITSDEPYTTYKDENGNLDDVYKFQYKNSIDNSLSLLSDEVPATGFPIESLWGLVEKAYKLFGRQSDKKFEKDWLVEFLNEGYRICVSKIIQLDNDFYFKTEVIPLTKNQSEYKLEDLLTKKWRRIKKVSIDFDGNGIYVEAKYSSIYDFVNVDEITKDNPILYFRQTSLVLEPSRYFNTGVSVAKIDYVYIPDDLRSDSHIPELPTEYAQNLVNWALFRMHQTDGRYDVAQNYRDLFVDTLESMILDLKKRHPSLSQELRYPGDIF